MLAAGDSGPRIRENLSLTRGRSGLAQRLRQIHEVEREHRDFSDRKNKGEADHPHLCMVSKTDDGFKSLLRQQFRKTPCELVFSVYTYG